VPGCRPGEISPVRDGRTAPSRLTIAHTDFLMLKLQAFAALGVALLAAAFYVVWFFGVMTTVTPDAGGLDVGSSNISRLSVGVIFAAVIAVGIAFFRQLWNGAKHTSH
jgi:nitrate reductase NapE component